jgi:hypothetical protein
MDRQAVPADGDADVARHAPGKIDDLAADAADCFWISFALGIRSSIPGMEAPSQ